MPFFGLFTLTTERPLDTAKEVDGGGSCNLTHSEAHGRTQPEGGEHGAAPLGAPAQQSDRGAHAVSTTRKAESGGLVAQSKLGYKDSQALGQSKRMKRRGFFLQSRILGPEQEKPLHPECWRHPRWNPRKKESLVEL